MFEFNRYDRLQSVYACDMSVIPLPVSVFSNVLKLVQTGLPISIYGNCSKIEDSKLLPSKGFRLNVK